MLEEPVDKFFISAIPPHSKKSWMPWVRCHAKVLEIQRKESVGFTVLRASCVCVC